MPVAGGAWTAAARDTQWHHDCHWQWRWQRRITRVVLSFYRDRDCDSESTPSRSTTHWQSLSLTRRLTTPSPSRGFFNFSEPQLTDECHHDCRNAPLAELDDRL
jgi:hypothetical protein